MEKIFEKFSLYDLVVYFVPGAVSLLIAYLYICSTFQDTSLTIQIDNGFILVLLFIVSAYFLSVCIHETGQIIETVIRSKKDTPSRRYYLKDGSSFISNEEIDKYIAHAKEIYNISIKDSLSADLYFQRVKTAIQEDECGKKAEILNNNYGLCRSFLALSAIYFIFFTICTILQFNSCNLLVALIFFAITLLLLRRVQRFAETYAKAVLRAGLEKILEVK